MAPSQETSGDGPETASDGSGLRDQAGQALAGGLHQAYAAALAGNGHLDAGMPSGLEGHGHNDPHALVNGGGLGIAAAQDPEEKTAAAGGAAGKRQKLARPETIEPCPRCGSSETKFCYYNNYNIKQPRFFCKGCQRYWTAGGTLRNVPPGSGRRKSKSQATKDQDKSSSLAEQLAKQSVATAMLSNPAGLAAAVPFLNPMLAAESTMLAYNAAAAQQQLLGTAALNALSKMPNLSGQWPGSINNSEGMGSPSGNGGGGQGSALTGGEDQHHDVSGHPAKRAKLESSSLKHEADNNGSHSTALMPTKASTGASGEEAAAAAASAAAMANGMSHHHMSSPNGGVMMNGQMVSIGNSWPGLNSTDHTLLNGMNQNDPNSMMGGKNGAQATAAAHNAAAAAQNALQQQHMAYQQMMHAQLLQQQLAAQAQVAAGLGQPNPYLSLQHLAAYNPFNYSAANPSLANLGFNPSAGR